MQSLDQIWESVLALLKEKSIKSVYDLWFADTKLVFLDGEKAAVTIDSLAAGASFDLTGAVNAIVNADAPDNITVTLQLTNSWTGCTIASSSMVSFCTRGLWKSRPLISISA